MLNIVDVYNEVVKSREMHMTSDHIPQPQPTYNVTLVAEFIHTLNLTILFEIHIQDLQVKLKVKQLICNVSKLRRECALVKISATCETKA